jgi:hypothetical protein
MKNACNLAGKPQRKKTNEASRHKWENNIKMKY